LCAYGDATTRLRDEAAMTLIRKFGETSNKEVEKVFMDLQERAAKTLDAEAVAREDQTTTYEVDVRYSGQGLVLTVGVNMKNFRAKGLETVARKFDK
jgi:N-methylhydantoinase A